MRACPQGGVGHDGGVSDDVRERRARQYAVCTYALEYDRVADGAEGVFDQALTNGLAAIVAHEWPGSEMGRRGVLSAAALVDVVEERGKRVDDEVRILRPDEPEWETVPWEDEPTPNFTSVRVGTLRDAIGATQAIRHARDAGKTPPQSLSATHIEALSALDHHPALYRLTDEMIDRAERSAADEDAVERERAIEYWDAVGSEERSRREGFDYVDAYAWTGEVERCEVTECPVCWQQAFVAGEFDSYLDEVGVGRCIACSYQRTRRVADDLAMTIQIKRAVEGDD